MIYKRQQRQRGDPRFELPLGPASLQALDAYFGVVLIAGETGCGKTTQVWDPTHPTVGIEGMRHYLQDLSTAFPDFWVEIDQYATVDTSSIMVTYRGSATNLGEYHHHKATGHASNFEGTNCFRYNHDRSRITHIDVYRSAFAEDLDEVGEKRQAQEGGFRELRLKRLVI